MRAAAFRIIGGQWRGRKINFTPSVRLRASADRVRESLFNCLGQRLDGKTCLDLFAGAGALGLEAASRGARVVCVERESGAAGALRRAAEKLSAENMTVRRCGAEDFLGAGAERFDLIFMDPPFADYADDPAWRRLLAAAERRLAADGLAYCESDRHFPPPSGWHAARRRRAGAVFWQLLRR